MELDLQVILLVGPQPPEVLDTLIADLTEESVITCVPVPSLQDVDPLIERLIPDLILFFGDALEAAGEDVAGFCTRFRETHPHHRPVFVVQTDAEETRRIEYFLSGVDDILPNAISPEEFRVRLLVHLRRNVNAHAHEVTTLPGLVFAAKVLHRRVARGLPWALAVIEVDYLNVYREVYGDLPANQVLRALAAMLGKTILLPDLICQSESNDFVLISQPDKVEKIANLLSRQFEAAAPNFYSEKDRKQGYIISVSDEKISRRVPLLSLSTGIATSQTRHYDTFVSVYNAALEMKALAKMLPGSHWMSERPRLCGEPVQPNPAEKPVILVVESDAALAFLLKTTLELQGYEVLAVSSRQDALEVFSRQEVRLVIVDSLLHGLPEGLALCRDMKASTPDIAILCASTLHDRDQVLKAGADLYLPKPFELVSLFTWIDRLLKGQ